MSTNKLDQEILAYSGFQALVCSLVQKCLEHLQSLLPSFPSVTLSISKNGGALEQPINLHSWKEVVQRVKPFRAPPPVAGANAAMSTEVRLGSGAGVPSTLSNSP